MCAARMRSRQSQMHLTDHREQQVVMTTRTTQGRISSLRSIMNKPTVPLPTDEAGHTPHCGSEIPAAQTRNHERGGAGLRRGGSCRALQQGVGVQRESLLRLVALWAGGEGENFDIRP